MKRLLGVAFVILACACVAVPTAYAQGQYATLTVQVTDAQGAVIPEAKVTVTHPATGVTRTAATNPDGLAVVANLSAGTYELTVERSGFGTYKQTVVLAVAQRLSLAVKLEVGAIATTVEVVAGGAVTVETENAMLSHVVSGDQLTELPTLTRDPYAFVGLSPGANNLGGSSTAGGSITGDTRGTGFAVNGARTSSGNFLLDGGENNENFVTGPQQPIPLDAVQEYSLQVNNYTAQYGRNSGFVANVITKSGGNDIHGSAYWFYRGAALTAARPDDNANNIQKANFVRNQFGFSAGGPIRKNKTFFFGSSEWVRVSSNAGTNYLVPTQQFLAGAAANTQAILTTYGLPTSGAPFITAQDLEDAGVCATCVATYGAATPLLGTNITTLPTDAGGGFAQENVFAVFKIDHNFSEKTSFFGRFTIQDQTFPDGANSQSPFEEFHTGVVVRNQNWNLTLNRSWTPSFQTQFGFSYIRAKNFQPAPLHTAPCFFPFGWQNIFEDSIVFPGYLPEFCFGFGIPFGGPQNVYQPQGHVTWSKGKHTLKFGGQYFHMRDNRTFGAYENFTYLMNTFDDAIAGGSDNIVQGAIDPRGHTVGDFYDTAIDGPYGPPSFIRHFRYNEVGVYFEDTWRVHPRVTLNLGLRWEYFGVQHSPKGEEQLDANLYLGRGETLFERIENARFARVIESPIGGFYRRDLDDWSPRLGVAWDIFGNRKTVLRGGWGIFYDRNFGNVTFNAIQNPPNYAVVFFDNLPWAVDQFTALPLTGFGPISSSARMLHESLKTARSHQFNLQLQQDLWGKAVVSFGYVGNNGYDLYSLNNLNRRQTCIYRTLSAPCPLGPFPLNRGRLNTTGLTGMNRRANEGWSRYDSFQVSVNTREIPGTGLRINSNYTWGHWIDNNSSFFGDSLLFGFGGFGFRDPFNPSADKADSDNDIRHRFLMSWIWDVPWARDTSGLTKRVLDGWSVNGIFQAQTGAAFPIWDGGNCDDSTFCGFPLLTGPHPDRQETDIGPNRFLLYDLTNFASTCAAGNPLGCTSSLILPAMVGRNTMRTPGIWDLNVILAKDIPVTAISETARFQFRSEFYNIFNHPNMFVNVNTNFAGFAGSEVTGGKFGNRAIQLALKFIW